MMECGLGDIIIIVTPQGSGCHGVCRCEGGGWCWVGVGALTWVGVEAMAV